MSDLDLKNCQIHVKFRENFSRLYSKVVSHVQVSDVLAVAEEISPGRDGRGRRVTAPRRIAPRRSRTAPRRPARPKWDRRRARERRCSPKAMAAPVKAAPGATCAETTERRSASFSRCGRSAPRPPRGARVRNPRRSQASARRFPLALGSHTPRSGRRASTPLPACYASTRVAGCRPGLREGKMPKSLAQSCTR